MDIADLILEDHHRQRRAFALLDAADLDDVARLEDPVVLKISDLDASETKDAIGDHNDLRDAVAAAALHEVGSDGWWEAVGAARAANTEHMGEEEDVSDKDPDDYVDDHT